MEATFRADDSHPKERFVYHGIGEYGESSYIDDVICRDQDYSGVWTAASDGVVETRTYFCHNWRSDVSAVVTSGGALVECAKYSIYGIPFGLCADNANCNGMIDVNDLNQINTWIAAPAYDVRGDLDANDLVALGNTGFLCLGRGVLSRARPSMARQRRSGTTCMLCSQFRHSHTLWPPPRPPQLRDEELRNRGGEYAPGGRFVKSLARSSFSLRPPQP